MLVIKKSVEELSKNPNDQIVIDEIETWSLSQCLEAAADCAEIASNLTHDSWLNRRFSDFVMDKLRRHDTE